MWCSEPKRKNNLLELWGGVLVEIDLDRLKQAISINNLATMLGMEIKGLRARCYNSKKHKNNDNHFSLHFDKKTNRYKCFVCQESGDVIDLYVKVKGKEFKQAVEELAKLCGLAYNTIVTKRRDKIPMNKKSLIEAKYNDYSGIYEELYNFCKGIDQESENYLVNRGLKKETINKFNIFSIKDYKTTEEHLKSKYNIEQLKMAGLLNDIGNLIFTKHKIIFPFFQNGKIVFLQGRLNKDLESVKYLNLNGRPVTLYNIDTLTDIQKNEKIFITEGVLDALILLQNGYRAIGIIGVNNFKYDYIDMFKGLDIVLALDNDPAGEEAIYRLAKMFYSKGQGISALKLPEGVKDITDFFTSKNKEDFEAIPVNPIELQEMPKPVSVFLASYYETLGDGTTKIIGIKTGLEELDKATLGLDGLIVIGGIAGQGKTSFVLQLAYDVSELGTPALFYSLEMPRRAIFTKIFSRLSSVKYSDIMLKGGRYLNEKKEDIYLSGEDSFYNLLTPEQVKNLGEAKEKINKVSDMLYIRTQEQGEEPINFESVEKEIEFIKSYHKSDKVLVVVDHLQVFELDNYKDQIDKENKLITGFKNIVEKTGATIILVSQKNKMGFSKAGLQTIKGSVDIVYLADVVMFLESETEKEDDVITSYNEQWQETTYKPLILYIKKNRYNAPCKLKLVFSGEYSSFEINTIEEEGNGR